VVSRTGKYRVCYFHLYPTRKLTCCPKTIIYSGFTIWTIACGLLSTLKPGIKPAVFVVYMLLAGIGAGQTLQTTVVAAQASVSRQDMSVVTAVRNVSQRALSTTVSDVSQFVRLLGGTLTLPIGSAIMYGYLHSLSQDLTLRQ
jgi:hypothetical protein